MTVFRWIARGLFERHKQIFLSLLTFRLMQKGLLDEEYNAIQMNFLVNCPLDTSVPRPAVLKDWLPEVAWYSVQSLIKIDPFEPFANHLEKEMPRRFNEWYNELAPEACKLPGDWKILDKQPFQKMLVTRCLRPDRVTAQLNTFIRNTLPKGDSFVDCDNTSSADDILQTSYVDASPSVPIFFILSPGANPIKNVENLARKMGMDPVKQIYQVALGQGQDVVANAFLDMGHKEGQWVMLQNVHLMPAFLNGMLKRMDGYAQEGSHINFRVFLTSDPTNSIPIELLQRSIKLTNEPPAGFKANMSRAFVSFKKEDFDEKDSKIKTILFGLVYFHTVMSERKKFGPKGFNMVYPFSEGDLRCSSIILQNYMDSGSAAGKIPWNDLKYLVGEIMYGGHIVNGFDLIICMAYLDGLLNDTILDEAELFPFAEGRVSFKCPVAASYEKYQEHIETELPPETPLAFGLHPNAEISFLTTQCNNLFGILVELQPKDGGGDSAGVMSTTEIA
jgi:dynein heavy chain